MSNRIYRYWMVAMLAVAGLLFAFAVYADDRGDWFQSLKVPMQGTSCCDVSDCHRTEAVWQAGGWWARVPAPAGGLVPVPRERVLQAPRSIDGDAYVCYNGAGILCFVPPWSSM